MKRIFVMGLTLLAVTALLAGPAGAKAGMGTLYYNDTIVRTVVPPSSIPQGGTENFYGIPAGAPGQLPVVATAPGDADYKGGKWAFHRVDWNTTPYLLTSEAAVLAAYNAGDVTITRIGSRDFKCPVQK